MKKKSLFRKSLKALSKELLYLIKNNANNAADEIKQLIIKINALIKAQGSFLQRRELKRVMGAAIIFVGMAFSNNANAQATYTAPVSNPFGLTSAYNFAATAKADFDNDGDLDILAQEYYGTFQYYQNIGTATNPSFASPQQNPFGLVAPYTNIGKVTIADLDNDGDYDVMACSYNTLTYSGDIQYFENIGTNTAPNFAAGVLNPFGIGSGTYINAPELVDLDNDGDFDLVSVAYNTAISGSEFRYQQNIGTATAPNFAPATTNPFGLTFPTTTYFGSISSADLDNDGDFDIIMGDISYGNFIYYQNTGTNAAPTFAAGTTNPFGLVATNAASAYQKINFPMFIDMDGDTDLDILSGEYGGDFIYFENTFITPPGPLAFLNIVISTPSCSPGGDGMITATATGGVGNITYKINTDSNTNGMFNNYTAGTYTLRIRDSLNTIVDSVITVNASIPPTWDTITTLVTDESCAGFQDGTINLGVLGGTAPFTYNLTPGGTNTTGSYNGLAPGAYTATVTDSKNCTATSLALNVNAATPINFVVDSTRNILCNGGIDGAIYTTGSGGSSSITYSISPVIGTQSPPGDFINLIATSYIVTASDANNCSVSSAVTLTEPTPVALIIQSSTNASSSIANDGSIVALANGGTPGYIYSIAPNAGTQAPPGTFSNLGAGNYTITTTDGNGCTTTIMSTVLADIPSNVNDLKALQIKVYPNPVEHILQIESEEKIISAQVFDLTGRAVLTEENIKDQLLVNSLPKGTYILRLRLQNGQEGKMIFQKN